jgi:two-component system, LytTR family, response regulator
MATKQILPVPTTIGKELIDCQRIVRIDGSRNYSIITLADGRKLLIAKTLGLVAGCLPSHFVRTHKSVIVNVQHIKRISKLAILLKDGSEAAIASRRFQYVSNVLSNHQQ